MEHSNPAVSVVVCSYNRYELLRGTIQSLMAQADHGSMEVLIVDNSPDASLASLFAKEFAGRDLVRFFHLAKPGLSYARNFGVGQASAPIVAFVDDDVILSPGWLQAIRGAFQEWTSPVGVVAGRVTLEWQSERPQWLGNDALGYLGLNDLGSKRIDLEGKGYVVGCNMAFDKKALEAAGGFSNGLGRVADGASLLSNEEVEVSDRIARAGFARIYEPKAHLKHIVSPERLNQRWFRKRAAWQAVSDVMTDSLHVSELKRDAQRRLRRLARCRSKNECLGLIDDKRTTRQHRSDHQFIYDMVLLALLGGDEAEHVPSRLEKLLRKTKLKP